MSDEDADDLGAMVVVHTSVLVSLLKRHELETRVAILKDAKMDAMATVAPGSNMAHAVASWIASFGRDAGVPAETLRKEGL